MKLPIISEWTKPRCAKLKLKGGKFCGGTMNNIKKGKPKSKNWSGYVTRHSFALDMEAGVFTWNDPRKIAKSLKKSARRSSRRKGTAYQSAISMLNFYINRAGKNLASSQRKILEQAKIELKIIFKKC